MEGLKNPNEDLKMLDQMESSASSVSSFVEKIRKLNIEKLEKSEQDEFLCIVHNYEDILTNLLKYIASEKPKFEYIKGLVIDNDLENYIKLCKDIDIDTPKDIYEQIIKLQKEVKDRKQKIGSSRRNKILQLILMGGVGIALVIASIVTAVITLASAGGAMPLLVPIITSGFTVFAGFGGFKIIYDIIQNGLEHAKLTEIDNNLEILEDHLNKIEKSTSDLKGESYKFGLDINFKRFNVANHNEHNIIKENCHMCHIEAIFKKLEKMENIIRYGGKKTNEDIIRNDVFKSFNNKVFYK